MITCLTNYIGLLGIQDNPVSGLYVNSLPGISSEMYDATNDNQDDYDSITAWERIEQRAINNFEQDLKNWAQKFYKHYSFISNTITGDIDSNSTDLSTSNNYIGWYFNSPAFKYNRNLVLNISSVELYLATPADFTIRVYNASTGDLLDSKFVEGGTTGINTVQLNYNYAFWRYPKVFICYDASEVSTKKSVDLLYTDPLAISKKSISNTAEVLAGSLTWNSDNGLILNYNIECSLDNFVCNRLGLFQQAFLYKLGIELCTEALWSDRVNRWTLTDTEEQKVLIDDFKEEYDKMMKSNLKGLRLQDDGYCFECNRALNYVYSHP